MKILEPSRWDLLAYPFRSGRRGKLSFYAKSLLSMAVPSPLCRKQLDNLLLSVEKHPERDDILSRAEYCCKLAPGSIDKSLISEGFRPLSSLSLRDAPSAYFLDAKEVLRFFPPSFPVSFLPGDITYVPQRPSLVKSRPVAGDNSAGVLLALNKIRHYNFINDRHSFEDKLGIACFRGKIRLKPKRIGLFEKYFSSPLVDLGCSPPQKEVPAKWCAPKLSCYGQLKCKFILTIEGNDVATNLKWVMSSNSIAMMPRPEYETVFEEGRLVPGVHYIEIKPDYSDLEEKIEYYASRPKEANCIIREAKRHVARFANPKKERLVALLTLDRYFKALGLR